MTGIKDEIIARQKLGATAGCEVYYAEKERNRNTFD